MTGCGSVSDAPAGREMTLSVPGMHCQQGCFPFVKETLEKQPGIESVELYPQPSDDEITDHRVRVRVGHDFDADQAIAALAKKGYKEAKVETP
jgi:copper chaperone CopZ